MFIITIGEACQGTKPRDKTQGQNPKEKLLEI